MKKAETKKKNKEQIAVMICLEYQWFATYWSQSECMRIFSIYI